MISNYNNHQYTTVIPLLQPLTEQDTANAKYRIILSRCYIETNTYEKAFSLLNTMAAGSSAYKYEAVWLTAMAYLKQDKTADCINLLETIPADDDLYIKAKQLLKELK